MLPPGSSDAASTPRRLADAVTRRPGFGDDGATLGAEASTVEVEGREDGARSLAPVAPASEEAARFPITGRGAYDIAGKFAQGGIGRILRAHDPVLGRTVALKELLVAGHRIDEDRFVREVLLTARLQHPGIVPVYAAGRWPSGEPFYAMKLVSGRSFDQVIADAHSSSARLALLPHVLAIAETLAYAHTQGIIHRDLKPGNVLVGEFGETVVIDWGLAKQLGGDGEDGGDGEHRAELEPASGPTQGQQLTHVGAIVGTPGYMSPEQADSGAVDARTDVYALGVILYQTLSGRLPYDAESAVELLFKTVYDPPVPLQQREPQVPEELVAIVEKAMARDLAARYPTAKAFADDLRRFQTGQIVAAHRYTAWELLVRVLRRYRNLLAVAAVALVIVIVTVMVSFRSVAQQRDVAVRAESAALVARNQAVERADVLALEQARLRVDYDPVLALDLLHRSSPGADWRRIRQIAAAVQQRGIPTVLYGHQSAISRAVFSPDSAYLATTSDDCTLRVWDLAGRSSRVFRGHTDEVWRASWSPDQRRVATTSRDQTVRVWDLDSGAAQVLVGHTDGVRNVTFGPEGRTVYSGDDSGALRRWDLDTGVGEVIDTCKGPSFPWTEHQLACMVDDGSELHVHDLDRGEVTRLRADGVVLSRTGATSPDTRWVAAGTTDGGVVVWDRTVASAPVLRLAQPSDGPGGQAREIRFSADSRRLLMPMMFDVLTTYNLADGTGKNLRPHTSYTRRAAFSPDAALIASVGGDVGVKLHDVENDSDRGLAGAQALMIDVQFSRDGHYLASVGNDPRVLVWRDEVFREQAWRMPGEGAVLADDAASADTSLLTRGTKMVVLDTATLTPRLELDLDRPLTAMAITPDATLAVGVDSEGLEIWALATGSRVHRVPLAASVGACELVMAPDGRHVALACTDQVLRWVELGSGRLQEVVGDFTGSVGFASSGELLLRDNALRIWQPGTGAPRLLHAYRGNVQALARVPGSPRVIVASDRSVDVWDLERMDRHSLVGHRLEVSMLAVSEDGRRLVTRSRDGILRVYDLGRGALLWSIPPTTFVGVRMSLSADGTMLACTTHDKKILLWDLGDELAPPLEPRLLEGHGSELAVLRFSADNSSLLGIDADGRAVRWADDLPRDAAGVRAWVAEHHDPLAATPVLGTGCLAPDSAPAP